MAKAMGECTAHVKDAEIQLVVFRRQYLQRVSVHAIQFPDDALLRVWEVQEWIAEFVQNASSLAPFPQHDKVFLKKLQLQIERAVQHAEEPDILDTFAESYSELLAMPASEDTDTPYVWLKYVPPWQPLNMNAPESGIDVLEKPNVLAAGGFTGHRTWEAALRLATMLHSPSLVKHIVKKNVLELGAGTGLLSLLCANLGAKHVFATDGDPNSIVRLQRSIDRNCFSASGTINAQQYIWGDDGDLPNIFFDTIDTVVSADVTYDPTGIPDLVASLKTIYSANPGVFVIISATKRNLETLSIFSQSCHSQGLRVVELRLDEAEAASNLQLGFFHAAVAPIALLQILPEHDVDHASTSQPLELELAGVDVSSVKRKSTE